MIRIPSAGSDGAKEDASQILPNMATWDHGPKSSCWTWKSYFCYFSIRLGSNFSIPQICGLEFKSIEEFRRQVLRLLT